MEKVRLLSFVCMFVHIFIHCEYKSMCHVNLGSQWIKHDGANRELDSLSLRPPTRCFQIFHYYRLQIRWTTTANLNRNLSLVLASPLWFLKLFLDVVFLSYCRLNNVSCIHLSMSLWILYLFFILCRRRRRRRRRRVFVIFVVVLVVVLVVSLLIFRRFTILFCFNSFSFFQLLFALADFRYNFHFYFPSIYQNICRFFSKVVYYLFIWLYHSYYYYLITIIINIYL